MDKERDIRKHEGIIDLKNKPLTIIFTHAHACLGYASLILIRKKM